VEYAKQAVALDDLNANCHKWYAINLGSSSDFLPIKEKIGNGFVFKKHLDKAIELNPNDYTLYHILGRFEFEVKLLFKFQLFNGLLPLKRQLIAQYFRC